MYSKPVSLSWGGIIAACVCASRERCSRSKDKRSGEVPKQPRDRSEQAAGRHPACADVFPHAVAHGPREAVSLWHRLAAPFGKSQRLLVNRVYEWTAVTDLPERSLPLTATSIIKKKMIVTGRKNVPQHPPTTPTTESSYQR